MSWNYRIFKTRYRHAFQTKDENYEIEEEDHYTIREVYYDESGNIVAMSSDPQGTTFVGETKDELKQALELAQKNFSLPILTPKDIPGYTLVPGEIEIPENELNEGETL